MPPSGSLGVKRLRGAIFFVALCGQIFPVILVHLSLLLSKKASPLCKKQQKELGMSCAFATNRTSASPKTNQNLS